MEAALAGLLLCPGLRDRAGCGAPSLECGDSRGCRARPGGPPRRATQRLWQLRSCAHGGDRAALWGCCGLHTAQPDDVGWGAEETCRAPMVWRARRSMSPSFCGFPCPWLGEQRYYYEGRERQSRLACSLCGRHRFGLSAARARGSISACWCWRSVGLPRPCCCACISSCCAGGAVPDVQEGVQVPPTRWRAPPPSLPNT